MLDKFPLNLSSKVSLHLAKKVSDLSFNKSTLICLSFLVYLFPASCFGTVIEGIVFSEQGPVPDAQVQAYTSFAAYTEKKDAILSVRGEKPGQFRIELPPGRYYFSAQGKQTSSQLFSFHGGNPITLKEEYYWMPFFAVVSTPSTCKDDPTGVNGQVFFKGLPVTRGSVSLYSTTDTIFRGMGLLTNTLDHEGKFRFDADPGSYVIIARQRLADTGMGPLQKGDLFCFPDANPIQILPDTSCQIDIHCYPRDDLNAFLEKQGGDPRGRKETTRRDASLQDIIKYDAADFLPNNQADQATLTGKVHDPSGTPMANLYVQAYPTDKDSLFQMYMVRLITDHIARTDAEGSFHINLRAGNYYLVAREKMGEAPDRNEHYGLYEGNANHSLVIEPGKEANITIVVEPIMPQGQ